MSEGNCYRDEERPPANELVLATLVTAMMNVTSCKAHIKSWTEDSANSLTLLEQATPGTLPRSAPIAVRT